MIIEAYQHKMHYQMKVLMLECCEVIINMDSLLIFGNGKAIHAHGMVEELRKHLPEPFKIILLENFKGI
ncbi:hypothetical protein [Acinetobacter terrestris]|uniref:hypothetical protein n=1 Tax=Acinetobacter terrestris TaxID=2529843 RepID=UPI00103FACF5|nr:hypothetical protein [Acinetobacter terrestris]TCB50822.1 hypothetical protein E0H84_14690 [Acinetobacter terrestris]